MAMTLQEAIDFASVHADTDPYGIECYATISMHDDSDTVLFGGAMFPTFTFRPDLPLLNWGTATIGGGGASIGVGGWFRRAQAPGFSTRGLGGATLNVATGTAVPLPTPIPIDLSVRRDPGLRYLSFLGLGPSVQIEIEKLSALGGTATSGVTLKAVEDGALLRAVGPSMRDPANTASYTVTINVMTRIG
jgi:hypothetical protein